MGLIRLSKEKEYEHLLSEAEKILHDGGMDSSYAPKLIKTLTNDKSDDVIEKKIGRMLKMKEYGKAAQLFIREEKHDTRSHYDWDEINDVNKVVLGSALEKIREYVVSMRFKK